MHCIVIDRETVVTTKIYRVEATSRYGNITDEAIKLARESHAPIAVDESFDMKHEVFEEQSRR